MQMEKRILQAAKASAVSKVCQSFYLCIYAASKVCQSYLCIYILIFFLIFITLNIQVTMARDIYIYI